jgi:hypothetical protein
MLRPEFLLLMQRCVATLVPPCTFKITQRKFDFMNRKKMPALSSDALTGWGSEDAHLHNERVR